MDRIALLAYAQTGKPRPSVPSIDLSPLTAKQRQCVEMAFFEGLTFRQIGQRFGTSHVSAIKHLRQAIAKLKGLPDATIIEKG